MKGRKLIRFFAGQCGLQKTTKNDMVPIPCATVVWVVYVPLLSCLATEGLLRALQALRLRDRSSVRQRDRCQLYRGLMIRWIVDCAIGLLGLLGLLWVSWNLKFTTSELRRPLAVVLAWLFLVPVVNELRHLPSIRGRRDWFAQVAERTCYWLYVNILGLFILLAIFSDIESGRLDPDILSWRRAEAPPILA